MATDPLTGAQIAPGIPTVQCPRRHINREDSWQETGGCNYPGCGYRGTPIEPSEPVNIQILNRSQIQPSQNQIEPSEPLNIQVLNRSQTQLNSNQIEPSEPLNIRVLNRSQTQLNSNQILPIVARPLWWPIFRRVLMDTSATAIVFTLMLVLIRVMNFDSGYLAETPMTGPLSAEIVGWIIIAIITTIISSVAMTAIRILWLRR